MIDGFLKPRPVEMSWLERESISAFPVNLMIMTKGKSWFAAGIRAESKNGLLLTLLTNSKSGIQVIIDPTGFRRPDQCWWRRVDRDFVDDPSCHTTGAGWEGVSNTVTLHDLLQKGEITRAGYQLAHSVKQITSTHGHRLLWKLATAKGLIDPLNNPDHASEKMAEFYEGREGWRYLGPLVEATMLLYFQKEPSGRKKTLVYDGRNNEKRLILRRKSFKDILLWILDEIPRTETREFMEAIGRGNRGNQNFISCRLTNWIDRDFEAGES